MNDSHLDPDALALLLHGRSGRRQRQTVVRHLSGLCPECWQVLRGGLVARRCAGRFERAPTPGSLARTLDRLLRFHAPDAEQGEILRPLLTRHRRLLETAHEAEGHFARLLLEECLVATPSPTTCYSAARRVRDLVDRSAGGRDVDRHGLRAWTEATLARAAHLSDADPACLRGHVREAVDAAHQAGDDPLLAVTLHEIRSFTEPPRSDSRIAHLDQALALTAELGEGWRPLRAELLSTKAAELTWQPEDVQALCREAIEILGDHGPPVLLLELHERLAQASFDADDADVGAAHLLAAQRLSEPSAERPHWACERWRTAAQLIGESDPPLSAACSRLAVAGFDDLGQDDACRAALVDLARFHIEAGRRGQYGGLDVELTRMLEADVLLDAGLVSELATLARERQVPAPALAALETRTRVREAF